MRSQIRGRAVNRPPNVATVLVDTAANQLGEFRGVMGPYWTLRPVGGGIEWEVRPTQLRLADPAERLRAETALANARSRGEVL
ncbi:hypothetical protein ACIQNG_24500 [Streptomyces sp. NPDC091377]|uniref:hypothetical protein n=1 Tax=Streptomyces sp. NPDC091377 TaxID=3365995 RepID=UPI00382D0D28